MIAETGGDMAVNIWWHEKHGQSVSRLPAKNGIARRVGATASW
jgi:hypothetical protein